MLKRDFLANKILVVILVSIVAIVTLAVGEAFAKEKKNITLVLWRGRTKSEDGFQKVINEVYDVNWSEMNADQDKNKLEGILKSIDPAKTNLIYTFGTTVTIRAKEMFKDVPVVFTSVYDPVIVGIVDSWERSGCNFIGGSMKVRAEGQINTLKKLVDFKRLGVIYIPKEKNSLISLKEIEALQSNFGFVVVPAALGSSEELDNTMRALDEGRVDAVICSAATMITTNAEAIANELIKRKIPSLSSVVETTDKGILLGLGVNYETLGEEVGRIALRVLKGEKPNNMRSITLEKYEVIVNSKTADKIGQKVPINILKIATKVIK